MKLQVSERWLIQVGYCLCAGGQALMHWFKINSVPRFIYWASIYLLKVTGGNTRWMYEIYWKFRIKTPDCYWRRSVALNINLKLILHLALVFLVFLLLILNSENPGWVVRVTVPKNRDIVLVLFVINVWFIVVIGELRTCDTSKMDLFAKIVYRLKSLTILTRSFILRSIRGAESASVFFQIYI